MLYHKVFDLKNKNRSVLIWWALELILGTFVLPPFNRSSLKQKPHKGKWNEQTICLFELNLYQRNRSIIQMIQSILFFLSWKYPVMLSDFGLQSNPINLKVKSYVSWPPVRFQLPWRLLSVLLYTSGVSESSRDLKAVVFSLSLLKRKEKNQ